MGCLLATDAWAQSTDNATAAPATQAGAPTTEALAQQIQAVAKAQSSGQSAQAAQMFGDLATVAPQILDMAKQQPAPPVVDLGIVAWHARARASTDVIFDQVNKNRNAETQKRFDAFQEKRYAPMVSSSPRPTDVASFNDIYQPISRR